MFFKALLAVICAEVMRQMERVIFKCSFNRLGALQLDREFRALTSYLTNISGWSVREKFSRFSQVEINLFISRK